MDTPVTPLVQEVLNLSQRFRKHKTSSEADDSKTMRSNTFTKTCLAVDKTGLRQAHDVMTGRWKPEEEDAVENM